MKKILDHEEPPGYLRSCVPRRPTVEPVLPIIRQILDDDAKAHRKQCHTAHRVWQRLRDEYGFTVVKDAVRQVKVGTKEVFLPLSHDVYDLRTNAGFVSVGIDHDTAAFAATTIRRWWWRMGRPLHPDATELLVRADGGGSNASRSRLWKVELQKLADDTRLTLRACHFPPGTSKWNKIEHRLFSHISINWRGRPLTSLARVVRLIGATKTESGLVVKADLDKGKYPTGLKVSDDDLAAYDARRMPSTGSGTTASGRSRSCNSYFPDKP